MELRVVRVAFLLLLLNPFAAMAAEIRVIAGGPLPAVFKELGPRFERDSGHKVNVGFASTATVRRQIDGGAEFDLVVTAASAIDDWIREGKVVAATRTPVAYAGLGLGVRAGTAKPDVSSADASRRTLLDVNTLGHGPESASATALQNVLTRLGITEEMKPKLRPIGSGMSKRLVAGELDAIVGAVPSIIAASGVELAGAFPPELQTYIPFAAAIAIAAKEPEAAQALIKFFTSPAAAAVLMAKGLEPGAPR